MYINYLVIPFATWCITGTLKFLINSIKHKTWAVNKIGYGGMPSNHSAIVCSTTTLICLNEGIGHPAAGLAIAFSFITMMDAVSLRRQIGNQASAINKLHQDHNRPAEPLRESIGHRPLEIAAGAFCGFLIGLLSWHFDLLLDV
jgi:uncharacterized protein